MSMEEMRRSFSDGEMTIELLLHSPYAPSDEKMTAEILKLSVMIGTEGSDAKKSELCAAFRALMWARSPDGYAPPSQSPIHG